jgi:hypothetical protein
VFIQTPVGGSWKGETIINDARPLQRSLNKVYTSINRHIGKADNARMILPMGAVIGEEDDITGDVGEVIRTDPGAGNEPHWMNAPQIPRWLREHKDDLTSELDDLFSTHDVTSGRAPGDRNSGLALSILAEKDETPLGMMAANQQRGWQRIAEGVLATMRHLMTKVDEATAAKGAQPMTVNDVRMSDDGMPQQVAWSAADLPADPVVHVPLESVMPRSTAARQEMMLSLAQQFPEMFGQFTPTQLANVLGISDPSAFAASADTQANQALWENSRMILGVGDEEVFIDDWHDHQKHIRYHNDLRSESAYRNASDEIRQYIDDHIEAHAVLFTQAQQQAAQAQLEQQMAMMGPPPLEGEVPADEAVQPEQGVAV